MSGRRTVRALLAVAAAAGSLGLTGFPAAATPPLPDPAKLYWFISWDIANVWRDGAQGQGVTVAVLDSGVNANRPELRGRVIAGTDATGRGGDGRTDRDQSRAHGTAMAMLVAGQGGPSGLVGIAPESRILPVVVLGDGRSGTEVIADGIRYAVDHGANVVNLSVSTPGNGYPNNCPENVQEAVRYAVGKGAVVVAAAGNSGDTGNSPEYPASCAGVLAVGAINGSKHVWPRSQRQSYVDVAAPGMSIPSINAAGQAGSSDGTSDAAALVSGAAALVWSKFPGLTNRQVVARLLATVTDDADTPGKDDATGYGIVRPDDAIRTPVPADAPNPVFDELDRVARSGAATGSSTSPAGPVAAGGSAPASVSGNHSGARTGIIVAVIAGLALLLIVPLAIIAGRRRRRAAPVPPARRVTTR